MEAYRREVEKMKQLQEGKAKEQEIERDARSISSRGGGDHCSPALPCLSLSLSLSPSLSLSLSLSPSPTFRRRPAQRRGAAEAHPAAARERDGVEGTNDSTRKKERKRRRQKRSRDRSSPLSFSFLLNPYCLALHPNLFSLEQELQSLDPDDGVFKLIGPALVKQEPDEAVQAVQTRLGFIGGELARLEEGGKRIGADADACQARCAELQQQAIRENTEAAGAGAGGAGGGVAAGGAQAQPAT